MAECSREVPAAETTVSTTSTAMADGVPDTHIKHKSVGIKQEPLDDSDECAFGEIAGELPSISEDSFQGKQEPNEDHCPITKAIAPPISSDQQTWNAIRNNSTALRRFSHLNPQMANIIAPNTVLNGQVRKVPFRVADRPLRCATCKRRFRHHRDLATHHRYRHPGLPLEEVPELQCGRCDKWFKSVSEVSKHMRVHDRRKKMKQERNTEEEESPS